MQKQKSNSNTYLLKTVFSLLVLFLFNMSSANAQNPFNLPSTNAQDELSNDNMQHTISSVGDWNYQDFKVPKNPKYANIYLTLRGADGGSRKYNDGMAINFHTGGGQGATIKASFKIGSGTNEIPAGSTMRFMIGNGGFTFDTYDSGGADGGGGTGVFVQLGDTWKVLAVAGGGGGAMADCCTIRHKGLPGETGESGSPGGHGKNPGGSNGNDGNASYIGTIRSGYGGGGLWSAWPGGKNDASKEPDGGSRVHDFKGKFGCGQGGANETYPGGGGGYSGGGGGNLEGGAGGGSSYVNPNMAENIIKIKNGSTTKPQDGYVMYQFENSLPIQSIRLAKNENKGIDLSSGVTTNGRNIQLWNFNETNTNQQWVFELDVIRLKKLQTKCMDLDQSNTANGTNIQLYNCNGTAAQNWIYDGISKQIRLKKNMDKCIDLSQGNTANGGNIQLWNCGTNNDNQKWEFFGLSNPSPEKPERIQHIHLANPFKNCMTIYGMDPTNGTDVLLGPCYKTNIKMRWILEDDQIKSIFAPGKCLDLKGNQDAGNNIQLWDCNGTNAQKWVYDGVTNSIRLKVNPDKCLGLRAADTAVGTSVKIKDCSGSESQKWILKEPTCLYDDTPPVPKCKDLSVSGTLFAPTVADINDGSYDNCQLGDISLENTNISGTAGTIKMITLTVKDAAGNSSSCEARITLLGN